MLDAAEVRGRAADRVRREAKVQANGDRGQRIRNVVPARDLQFAGRHDTAPLFIDDPVIDHAKTAGQRLRAAVEDDARPCGFGELAAHGILGIEHQGPVDRQQFGQAALDGTICPQAAVAI